MQNIRGKTKVIKKKNIRSLKTGLAIVIAGLLVINIIPESVFASAFDDTNTSEMTAVSEDELVDELTTTNESDNNDEEKDNDGNITDEKIIVDNNSEGGDMKLLGESKGEAGAGESGEPADGDDGKDDDGSKDDDGNSDDGSKDDDGNGDDGSKDDDGNGDDGSKDDDGNSDDGSKDDDGNTDDGSKDNDKGGGKIIEDEAGDGDKKPDKDGDENPEEPEPGIKDPGSEDIGEDPGEEEDYPESYTDGGTGIRINAVDDGALKYSTNFVARNVTGDMAANVRTSIINESGVTPSNYSISAYDLALYADGNEIDPSGQVQIWIPGYLSADYYEHYEIYTFEAGEPSRVTVSNEGSYRFFVTRTLDRIYIFEYDAVQIPEEENPDPGKEDGKLQFSLTATVVLDGEKAEDVGTVEIKDYDKIAPKAEISIDITAKPDSTTKVTFVAKPKEGYEFVGWFGNALGEGEALAEGTELLVEKYEDNHFYAVFKEIIQKEEPKLLNVRAYVVVDGVRNEGAGKIGVLNTSITPKASLALQVSSDEKGFSLFVEESNEKYSFTGWYEDIEGKELITKEAQLDIEKVEAKTYYAVFNKEYEEETVSVKAYVAVGGERNATAAKISLINTNYTPKSAMSLAIVKNESFTLKAEATATNYSFLGWYDNIDGEGEALCTDATFKVDKASEAVYYAIFEKYVAVSVLYASDSTKSMGSISVNDEDTSYVKRGTTFTLKASPKEGYSFVGWYDQKNTSGVTVVSTETTYSVKLASGFSAAELKYYAKFAANNHAEVKVSDNTATITDKYGSLEKVVYQYSGTKKYSYDSWYKFYKNGQGYDSDGNRKSDYSDNKERYAWNGQNGYIAIEDNIPNAKITLEYAGFYTFLFYYRDGTVEAHSFEVDNDLYPTVKKGKAPEINLSNGKVYITTNGINLKKGYYQLTSVDVTAKTCPIEYTSWYRFIQTGIAKEVVNFNGENGYLNISDLSDGASVPIVYSGWYTFFFKDAEDNIYDRYILVETDTLIAPSIVTASVEKEPKTTTSSASNKKTTTSSSSKKTTTKETKEVKEEIKEEPTHLKIEATITQKSSEEEEANMLFTYQDAETSGEKITKYAYAYVGQEEPAECTSWYQMVSSSKNINQETKVRVDYTYDGRSFEFPVDKAGWYYVCVSNEDVKEQYYKAYADNATKTVRNNDIEIDVLGAYITANLQETKVAFIKTDENENFQKGNRIKVKEAGFHDIYVIDDMGNIYMTEVEVRSDVIDRSYLSKYISMLQDYIYEVEPVAEDKMSSIQMSGKYCDEYIYNKADDVRLEVTQVLEDLYATQYEIDYATQMAKATYEELKSKIIEIDNELIKVNGNSITVKSPAGQFLTYVVYPVDENGRMTPSMWTTYAGLTSDTYVRNTIFDSDESETFTELKPGVYSFAIRTGGRVLYRNAIICDEDMDEIDMVQYALDGSEGLFSRATKIYRKNTGNNPIYDQLKEELNNTYEAYDRYSNEGQLQLLINQASKLNGIIVRIEKMEESNQLEYKSVKLDVTKKDESTEGPGLSIVEK